MLELKIHFQPIFTFYDLFSEMLSPSDTNPLVVSPEKRTSSIIANNVVISVKLDDAETAISYAERSVMIMPESMEGSFRLEDIANESMKRQQHVLSALSIINQIEKEYKREEVLLVNLKRIASCRERIDLIGKKRNQRIVGDLQSVGGPGSTPSNSDDCKSKWFCVLL